MSNIVYKLSEPFKFEDKEYTELSFNFKGLSGKDVKQARRMFEETARVVPMLALDEEFCELMAAKAAGVPYEFMSELPASDYLAIITMTQNFFMKSGFSGQIKAVSAE